MNAFLASNVVEFWHLDSTHYQANLFAALLSKDETMRAKRFHFPIHAERFIITHGILRKILSLYTGIDPTEIIFSTYSQGKPFLAEFENTLAFNLSHSGHQILIAVTAGMPVGVDIEMIKTDIDLQIAKRFFHREEYASLMALPEDERTHTFFRLWSGKEAVIKMLGTGLSGALNTFVIHPNKSAQSIQLETGGACFLSYLDIPNCAAAIAVPKDNCHLKQRFLL